ncbi:hypothetical protein CLAFUW4_11973 [Fulvia fulva]|uniref:Uncharacterized protein n=1 Tax=Passalora fulva TaxID=5499 RepID=A0A9Q8PF73_PASFU|nr:uncharacterized protein CLAFUR5_11015 [Fulvia fulva]KAK4618015.1 hypothetical protein CLAFUR4_11978 [Fulvia fulva]KAK4619095.1 hypothetical protein CLAFUR0_11989 [Fulvia fulva]UJO21319.1 hypothetical protein CLAFUR5_11015 [Fulvia fulva]WPV18056.1 hypothetical protein CLAFUW4_11973 [Fulvia fulva]WPV33106.1 hypothetical protein CLAFUW7_11980 [Fulvia fulva]
MAKVDVEESPLLRLPPELRNRIYHELLANTPGIFHLNEENMAHPILNTNRQLRSECTGIFYANTTLQFSSPAVCTRRLTTLDPKIVDLIPELRYDTSETCTKAMSWRTAFRELPGLDEDTKLENLKDELKREGVALRLGVLKARICIAGGPSWTSDPLAAALDAVKQGVMVSRMMFM